MELIEKLAEILKSEFPKIKKENFEFPSEFGDISCNICFVEAKNKETNPIKLAEEIAKKIKLPKEFEKVESINGYLNFYLNYKEILDTILKEKIKKIGKGKVMVEFSDPNPCKAMHLGHARTTFLGDSISRILDFLGYKVIRANYYNDMGKQVAKEILAYQKYGLKKEKKVDHELAEIYAKLHSEENQEEIERKAQEILYGLEKEGKYKEIWKEIVELAIQCFEETYEKLNIKFDINFFESEFREKGKEIANILLTKGIGYRDEGAIVVDLERYELPNIVVLRKDGTGLYITADLALTIHKFEEFNLERSIWVVGSEQDVYFKQLFKIFELLDYEWYNKCEHVSYGVITFKGSKMSSRAGRYILLDDLINELIEKAKEEVKKRGEKDKEKILEIAKKIGVGALKYEILKVERNKTIDFDPSRAILFEGNTSPYLQYSIVRCNSILKKYKGDLNYEINEFNEFEKALLRKFLEFSTVIEKAGTQLKPNLICNYAYELATLFSRFYENCKVIGSEKENFRIALVRKTREILEICLSLLGIEVPEKM
jgi:arginyl-tRNA synthetase